jgi:hypothetical protein
MRARYISTGLNDVAASGGTRAKTTLFARRVG